MSGSVWGGEIAYLTAELLIHLVHTDGRTRAAQPRTLGLSHCSVRALPENNRRTGRYRAALPSLSAVNRPCGSSIWLCSFSNSLRLRKDSPRASPTTWMTISPKESRLCAGRFWASCAFGVHRIPRWARHRSRFRWRWCCFIIARRSCWRSARAMRRPRARGRAARRIITPKRCRGSTWCRCALIPVSADADSHFNDWTIQIMHLDI